jgi:predicted transcriptional regulator
MSVTTVRLQPEIEQSLQAMTSSTHRSKSWLINQAVKEFIERQDIEQSRWQQTLQAMESVAQGRVVSGEAVHTWLQSWETDKELPPPEIGK